MSIGNKDLVDAVLSDLGPGAFLDGLMRDQGEKVSREVSALVATSVEMNGISINRLDRMLEDDVVREEHGLGGEPPGPYIEQSNASAGTATTSSTSSERHWGRSTASAWTRFSRAGSANFEAPQNKFIRVGYSHDHRLDRPQVTVGLSVDKGSGMPVVLTIMRPGTSST